MQAHPIFLKQDLADPRHARGIGCQECHYLVRLQAHHLHHRLLDLKARVVFMIGLDNLNPDPDRYGRRCTLAILDLSLLRLTRGQKTIRCRTTHTHLCTSIQAMCPATRAWLKALSRHLRISPAQLSDLPPRIHLQSYREVPQYVIAPSKVFVNVELKVEIQYY